MFSNHKMVAFPILQANRPTYTLVRRYGRSAIVAGVHVALFVAGVLTGTVPELVGVNR